jgi:hypothetical protein
MAIPSEISGESRFSVSSRSKDPEAGLVVLIRAFEGGGSQRDLVLLCNALAANGATPTIVTLRGDGPLRSLLDRSSRDRRAGRKTALCASRLAASPWRRPFARAAWCRCRPRSSHSGRSGSAWPRCIRAARGRRTNDQILLKSICASGTTPTGKSPAPTTADLIWRGDSNIQHSTILPTRRAGGRQAAGVRGRGWLARNPATRLPNGTRHHVQTF